LKFRNKKRNQTCNPTPLKCDDKRDVFCLIDHHFGLAESIDNDSDHPNWKAKFAHFHHTFQSELAANPPSELF